METIEVFTRMKTTALASVLIIIVSSVLVQTGFGAFIFIDSGQNLGDGRIFSAPLGDLDGDEDLD